MDKLNQMAIFFPVQQNNQSVPVPEALAQHQGLSKEQMEAIHFSTVSVVPVAQEKIGGRTTTAQYPFHTVPKLMKGKKIRWIKWSRKNPAAFGQNGGARSGVAHGSGGGLGVGPLVQNRYRWRRGRGANFFHILGLMRSSTLFSHRRKLHHSRKCNRWLFKRRCDLNCSFINVL